MTLPSSLDPDLLRAFAYVAEEGSFTRAAERVGRTQSAVSMQVQRLEALLGQRVLTRGKGEAVSLTAHGQYLLERSRDLLALNDEIWSTFRAPPVQGTVRLGTPDDYALRFLPGVLKRFADTHPSVEVDVTCASSKPLVGMLKAGELDLTLCSQGHEPSAWPGELLWRGPLMWITSERQSPHRLDPLPLALAAGECAWRTLALRALERAGRRYRVAYTSETQAGTLTPVLAGLAVTVSPVTLMPAGLRALPVGEPLPALPEVGIVLLQAQERPQAAAAALASHILETFRAELKRPS
jgi:DNA-binding transcriptional LysR family regulator